jgi:hypothetical protein
MSRAKRAGDKPPRVQIAETDPLDAEDIALARLQVQLRETEGVPPPGRRPAATLSRTTVRLPIEMLQRLRERAHREKLTLSEVIEAALERHLKTP